LINKTNLFVKQLILLSLLALSTTISIAQKDPRLLGICSAKDLEQQPYANWYKPNYEAYTPNPEIIGQLKSLRLEKFTLKIVFGSWCGDSKRELPRMMKVLSAIGLPEKNVQLIGVYDSMPVYKQAPKHEEQGLNIYRVPTFIVYKKNVEIGRIVEYPIESLERDLLKILDGQPYAHNYKSYARINDWLAQGLLSDSNIDPRGLSQQIRNDVARETELNSCGYVLLRRQKVNEAITVFRINTSLYPQSPNCFDSLGEAYLAAGMKDKSKSCYQRVLELDPQHVNARAQLEKIN
jgi:tetratricopeptide (TPR) repeat protein